MSVTEWKMEDDIIEGAHYEHASYSIIDSSDVHASKTDKDKEQNGLAQKREQACKKYLAKN